MFLQKKQLSKEDGLTLVEIIASIAILSIILFVILFVLLQSIQANKTSEEIVDATYIAQTTMEHIYDTSQTKPYDQWLANQERKTSEKNHDKVSFEQENFIIDIMISDYDDTELKHISIYVYEDTVQTNAIAHMENLLNWSATSDE